MPMAVKVLAAKSITLSPLITAPANISVVGNVVLVGTDNDYSVTQTSSGTQYDVFFRFTDADPFVSSIQCPIGTKSNCFLTSGASLTPPTPATLTSEYVLMPGILSAFTANITSYVKP